MSSDRIPGWDPVSQVYREWLKTPPRQGAVVVEVGVALGKSLTVIADWCIENKRDDIQLWAVDSWEHNEPNGEQQTMASVAGGDFSLYAKMMLEHDPPAFERIRVIRAASERAARLFDDGSVDCCVIDADHRYEGCLTDIRSWLPKVRSGGMMGGDDHHDTYHPGVVRACRETFGDGYTVLSGREATGWEDGRVWVRRVP